jgi:hypothetical protein
MEFVAWLFFGFINLILCFVVAGLWERKGHSYGGGWWLTFFFGCIIGFIVGMCLDDISKKAST